MSTLRPMPWDLLLWPSFTTVHRPLVTCLPLQQSSCVLPA